MLLILARVCFSVKEKRLSEKRVSQHGRLGCALPLLRQTLSEGDRQDE